MDESICTSSRAIFTALIADLDYEKVWVIFFVDTVNTVFNAIFIYDGVIKHFGRWQRTSSRMMF